MKERPVSLMGLRGRNPNRFRFPPSHSAYLHSALRPDSSRCSAARSGESGQAAARGLALAVAGSRQTPLDDPLKTSPADTASRPASKVGRPGFQVARRGVEWLHVHASIIGAYASIGRGAC